ncbi:MAG TPA: hypothetical protein VM778_08370 [Gemmatimonadota bacterium]|nr:hypothetical protein [Gemmatimonadota bacterium]
MTAPGPESPGDLRPFPPGSGRILVPTDSRAAALAALALYPACRSGSAIAQRFARGAVRLAGARVLPRGPAWFPPLPAAGWSSVRETWRSEIGGFDSLAIHRRSSGDEAGFGVLLLEGGEPRAFVKLRRGTSRIDTESRALELLNGRPAHAFQAPAVLGRGVVGEWRWLALEPLPPRVHRMPADPDLEAIAEEIGDALGAFPRPSGAPPDWRPMHGDLTPWNLREVDGTLWLMDWEAAGWGPPGADPVLYRATAAALTGRRARPTWSSEAVTFWRGAVGQWGSSPRDRRMAAAVDRALASMGERAT